MSQISYEEFKEKEKEKREKLRLLFMEMLDYKKRKYKKDKSYEKLLDQVISCYHYYNYELLELKEISTTYHYQFYPEDPPEAYSYNGILRVLDESYEKLKENDNYKKNDIEFKRKRNQTWEERIDEEDQKFIPLFHEMLDYLNVSYDKNLPLSKLRDLVASYYPYFKDQIYIRPLFFYDNSISTLLMMYFNYNYMLHHYKDHEENLKRYKEATYDVGPEGMDIEEEES